MESATVTADKKIVRAWTYYDWANSAYSLVITSALFPIYFNAVTTTATSKEVSFLGRVFNSDSLQTYSISVAFLIIALLSPLLSSMADYSGKKKKFMFFFSTLGALSCSALYFFTDINTLWIGVFGSMLAALGYAGSIVFYNAFLPEIAAPADQDKISAKGFAMGYIGSSLLLIFCLTMVLFPAWYGNISGGFATRLSFLLVGIWWVAFAQIPFAYLPISAKSERQLKNHILFNGFHELKQVWDQMIRMPVLKRYLGAFFFYSMGVQTVMLVAIDFGIKELKLANDRLIITAVLIQLVAIAGAIGMSRLSEKFGNLRILIATVLLWVLVCIIGYFVTTETQFYILAGLVGLVMGGIQSLSRSTYSKLMPETNDTTSFFSFYDVTEKLSIVIGLFSFGFIEGFSGSMRNSILALIVFFVLGLVWLLLTSAKQQQQNKQAVS